MTFRRTSPIDGMGVAVVDEETRPEGSPAFGIVTTFKREVVLKGDDVRSR